MADEWKLIIYPFAFLMIVGALLNIIVSPFTDEGISVGFEPNGVLDYYKGVIETGSVFYDILSFDVFGITISLDYPVQLIYSLIMPDVIKNFLLSQLTLFYYLPSEIGVPLIILMTIALILAIYQIIVMLIP